MCCPLQAYTSDGGASPVNSDVWPANLPLGKDTSFSERQRHSDVAASDLMAANGARACATMARKLDSQDHQWTQRQHSVQMLQAAFRGQAGRLQAQHGICFGDLMRGPGCRIPETAMRAISLEQLGYIKDHISRRITHEGERWKVNRFPDGQRKAIELSTPQQANLYDCNEFVITPATHVRQCRLQAPM